MPTPSGRLHKLAAAAAIAVLVATAPPAGAAPATKVVDYRGVRLNVPRGWPVFDLRRHPSTCVRFDRHAVYLGVPGTAPVCSVRPAGRTEAILVQPAGSRVPTLPAVSLPRADARFGTLAQRVERRARVTITATWNRDPAVIARALGVRAAATPALAARSRRRPSPAPAALARRRAARTAATSPYPVAPATPGQVYTGQGFDACSTPSAAALSAWSASPDRAVGVYIGGANMACAQPNLTPSWVAGAASAGWHLVPIYVGLQAPGNGCGCAAITAGSAAAQGAAAASDAVAQAQALGLGPGNPLYYDMEAYPRTAATTATVLAFLQAWTQALHGAGYLSGVYSSDASGIADLGAQYGTAYVEPDEIWAANWNGQANTADAYVPASAWANHQRLHQYRGAHDERYGGVTINIDSDYLDAATAAAGSGASVAAAPPAAQHAPTIAGAPIAGQVLREGHGLWSGSPSSYAYQWEDCDRTGAACQPIPGAVDPTYAVTGADVGHTIRVVEDATGPGGTGFAARSAATGVTQAKPTSGYWLYTAYGNVMNSPGAGFFGSAARRRLTNVSGMAATPDGRGYWLVTRSGTLLAYGDARRLAMPHSPRPVIGIAAASTRAAWIYTAQGNVLKVGTAGFYGSPVSRHQRVAPLVGVVPTRDGRGYWVATRTGQLLNYGDARRINGLRSAAPVRGVAAAPGGHGLWLFTAGGDIYALGGAGFYGSATGTGVRDVVGMAATASGRGYWLIERSGTLLPFGDAATYRVPGHAHPLIGIAGS